MAPSLFRKISRLSIRGGEKQSSPPSFWYRRRSFVILVSFLIFAWIFQPEFQRVLEIFRIPDLQALLLRLRPFPSPANQFQFYIAHAYVWLVRSLRSPVFWGMVILGVDAVLRSFVWERIYLCGVLPVCVSKKRRKRKEEKEAEKSLKHSFKIYKRPQILHTLFNLDLHGPIYYVMCGQPIETYNPRRKGPQLIILDSTSAAIVYDETQGEGWRVLGPGVHFLKAGRPKAFVDLREQTFLLKGTLESHPTRTKAHGVDIAADIFLIVHLEDFSDDAWPSEFRQAVHALWENLYGASVEHLQSSRFRPYFGHPASLLRNFQTQEWPSEDEVVDRFPWWEPAKRIAIQLWHQLIEQYQPLELYPSGWHIHEQMAQNPRYRTGYERLVAEFRERLTSPFYTDAKDQRRPSPEFRRLLEYGIRVRRANITLIHFPGEVNRALYQSYLSPWTQHVHTYQKAVDVLRRYTEQTAHMEALNHWMRYLAEKLDDDETPPALRAFLDGLANGQAGSLDLISHRYSLRWEALEVLLRTWAQILQSPQINENESRRTLQTLRTWLQHFRQDVR